MPAIVDENHPRWLDVVDLEQRIARCTECSGMNQRGKTQSAPGHGWLNSPVVMVGQSLCGGPCMKSGIPFTGGSGELLDKSFEKADIEKHQVFITNVVHCHPPKNHASLPDWVAKCTPYLYEELEIVQPKLMIALGEDAESALRRRYPATRELRWPFPVAGVTRHAGVVPDILVAKHPSWIKRQHDSALEDEYVSYLARSLTWAFRDVPNEARPKAPLGH